MKAIIHAIVRESGQDKPVTFPSDELLTDDEAKPLVDKLFNLFERSTGDRKYVHFLNNEAIVSETVKSFPVALASYFNDQEFVTFTIAALVSLTELINKISGARGGYYIFCERNGFIGIFLVRDSSGNVFVREEKSAKRQIRVNNLIYTNLDKLAFSCVLNLNLLSRCVDQLWNAPRECLSLIFSQEESNYFYEWLCLEKDSAKSSNSFNESLVKGLTWLSNSGERPVNPQTNQPYLADEFREEAKNFLLSSGDRKVHLRKLSDHFYGDPRQLPNWLASQGLVLDEVFDANKVKLEKLSKVTLNAGPIRLTLPRAFFEDERIRVDEMRGKTLVIIESDELASQIRSYNGKAD